MVGAGAAKPRGRAAIAQLGHLAVSHPAPGRTADTSVRDTSAAKVAKTKLAGTAGC